ncbi:MAG: GDSL-type esterase/lipase family protein [Patescibacteria group bacterium]|jgi:lysophospholipase L1-like esterase
MYFFNTKINKKVRGGGLNGKVKFFGISKYKILLSLFFVLGVCFFGGAVASAAERYWVGGSGNWSDAATHWAATSGGSPDAGNLPTSSDNCFFDSNSSANSYSVNVNATGYCNNVTWANPATGNPTLFIAGGVSLFSYGSTVLVSGMTYGDGGGYTRFAPATGTTTTLNTNGVQIKTSLIMSGTGTLQLASNVDFGLAVLFALNSGYFDPNAHAVSFSGTAHTLTGNISFYDLTRTGTNSKTNTFTLAGDITVTHSLTINGNSSTNRMLVASDTINLRRIINAISISISNTDFRDVSLPTKSIGAIGDSITRGYPTPANNGSYPQFLTTELNSNEYGYGVYNFGVDGQKTDAMLARISSITSLQNVRYAIVLGGVNDIRSGYSVASTESNLQSMYTALKTAGLTVIAAKITPWKGHSEWYEAAQIKTDQINDWIQNSATDVDIVAETYTALEDPSDPDKLLPIYDNGDHLHPSAAGYAAIANTIYSAVTWELASMNDLSNISGRSGDCGGNSSILFTTSTPQYWYKLSGASNNWSTDGNWYLSSGGIGGAGRVPLCQDTAIFDSASFGSTGMTLIQDMPRISTTTFLGLNGESGITNNPTFTTSTATSIFGSLTLAPVASWTFSASTQLYTFEGRSSYTLTTNGNTWGKNLTLNAPGGTLTLVDTPTMGASNTFTVTNGTLNIASKVMNIAPTTFITLAGGTANIYNSVFWRASAGSIFINQSGGTLNLKDDIFYNITDVLSSTAGTQSISYNDYYNSSNEGGTGSIITDPKFVTFGSDFHLQSDSPAIDAGYDTDIATDYAGKQRYDDPDVVNTGAGAVDYYDMGAYEYVTPPDPTFTSSSHPSHVTWYSDALVDMSLSSNGSSTTNYHYLVSQNSTPTQVEVLAGTFDADGIFTATVPSDGVWYIHTIAVNLDNDPSNNYNSYLVQIDTTPPSIPGDPITTSPTNNNKPEWTWTASTDTTSGLGDPAYNVQWCDNSSFIGCDLNISTAIANSFTHTISLIDGTWYFRVNAVDIADNISDWSATGSVIIDTEAPVTTATPAGGTYDNAQAVTLTTDETAITYYTLDGIDPTTLSTQYTTPITISETATLKFFSVDILGHTESIKTENYVIISAILFTEKLNLENVILNQTYQSVTDNADLLFYLLPKQKVIKDLYIKLIRNKKKHLNGFTKKNSYPGYLKLLSNIGTVKKAYQKNVNKHINFRVSVRYSKTKLNKTNIKEKNLRLFIKDRDNIWRGPYRIYQNKTTHTLKFKIRNYLVKPPKNPIPNPLDIKTKNRPFAPSFYFRTLKKIKFVIAEKNALSNLTNSETSDSQDFFFE